MFLGEEITNLSFVIVVSIPGALLGSSCHAIGNLRILSKVMLPEHSEQGNLTVKTVLVVMRDLNSI
mgnify:CR=1 FL=1|jgi:hypothetical protein